jgi:hypothetical protein
MNFDTMSDFEVALMDAIKTIIEVLVAKQIIKPEMLDGALQKQREAYPQTTMPGAVFVFDELRRVLNDAQRVQASRASKQTKQGAGLGISTGGSTDLWPLFRNDWLNRDLQSHLRSLQRWSRPVR